MKLIIGITGASGSIHAKQFIDKLQTMQNQIEDCGIVMSDNAKSVWQYELGDDSIKNSLLSFMKPTIFMLLLLPVRLDIIQ